VAQIQKILLPCFRLSTLNLFHLLCKHRFRKTELQPLDYSPARKRNQLLHALSNQRQRQTNQGTHDMFVLQGRIYRGVWPQCESRPGLSQHPKESH